jgi:hypothetical protein
MRPNLLTAYTVLTGSDHKGVVIQLGAPPMAKGKSRYRFPTDLLKDEAASNALGTALQNLDT